MFLSNCRFSGRIRIRFATAMETWNPEPDLGS